MKYLEIAITVPTLAAESVAWSLTERGLPGVVIEERKPDDPPKPTTTLKAYLPEVAVTDLGDLRVAVSEALNALDSNATYEVATREVPEEDWATSWQQYWHVQRIGKHLVVRPSWEEYEAQPDDVVLTLDPKMAFGTGTHPTTRLCMRMGEELAEKGPLGEVYDVGTGTGILAIVAVLLGAPRAVAVDTDPVAIAASEENVQLNGVADKIDLAVGSVDELPGQAPVVFANILAEVIIDLAAKLFAHTAPGGHLIASGIIQRKADAVARELTFVGFEVLEREVEGEWLGLLARRPL